MRRVWIKIQRNSEVERSDVKLNQMTSVFSVVIIVISGASICIADTSPRASQTLSHLSPLLPDEADTAIIIPMLQMRNHKMEIDMRLSNLPRSHNCSVTELFCAAVFCRMQSYTNPSVFALNCAVMWMRENRAADSRREGRFGNHNERLSQGIRDEYHCGGAWRAPLRL